ncbi:MAG: Tad domain-containing protein, partial [Pirellulaceae bacterium]
MKTGRRRRGYTLVFFAMMLFGIMAMAALVIDIGFARLTQRQMQTAVDAAALEGLRFRDDYPPGYSAPTSLEDARRQQASDIVVWMFDDDFEPSNGDPFHFGAGPRIELGPGIDDSGKINASQFISSPENPNRNPKIGSLPNPPVYKPSGLEPNAGDVVHGDMVAGIYNQDGVHGEDSNYNRGDFTPKPAITDPHAPDDESFLVRMRRLHNDFDVVDTEEDISSKGSEIPFLFGRGAMLPIENPDGEYLPRIHGIAVRATAIADA